MTGDEKLFRPRGKPTILIVEDNSSLATCLEMLLETHGYEVWRTIDGSGGLESMKLKDFDVVLCDLVMPGLCGDILHAAVSLFKPHLCERFIFMSGQLENLPEVEGDTCMGRPILRKPFAAEQLLQAIQDVLQSGPSEPTSPKRALTK